MIKKIFILSSLSFVLGVSAQKTHTVSKGDTPYSIAKKYGMSVDDLIKINPKAKDGKLAIGDVLTIKKGSSNNASAPVSSNEKGEIYVQPKQTIYGITRQYKISEDELRQLNPGLESGMKIGDKLVLPADRIKKYADKDAFKPAPVAVDNPSSSTSTVSTRPVIDTSSSSSRDLGSQEEYATYTVVQGDTVFSIVNKFGITIDELIALNPELSKGLKTGMVLKVKKLDATYVKKNGDALSVVLMLPFGYNSNDTQYRSMALDFLTGAKLAIERNARNGQKLDIKVVDSGNEASFKSSLTQINPNNTDLIIGPFFKSNVIDVLDFTKANKIPVVAPFANSPELQSHSNLIIIETEDKVYADKIVDEVKSVYSDQKIYILGNSKDENVTYLKNNLEKGIKNPKVTVVSSASEIKADVNMMTGQSAPVIAILASNNDDVGEAFANRMITLGKETPDIKAFSMFYAPAFERKQDDLGVANLVYLMDRKINPDGSFEKEILAAYKAKYCKTPGKYAIIGFDVVNDMLTRENKKGEIFKQMGRTQTQLATKFEFTKPKAGGAYVNTGYRVVRLNP